MTPSGIAIGTAISESPGPIGHNALINGILKVSALWVVYCAQWCFSSAVMRNALSNIILYFIYLQAIAAGTFINVTFLEILKDNLSSDSGFGKIFALTMGYVLMALLSLIPIQNDDPVAENITNGTTLII